MDEETLYPLLQHLDHLQSACTDCGLCLEGCPSYQSSGWEHESPRGKVRLSRDLLAGRIHPSSSALAPFEDCADCAACAPLCPTQVSLPRIRRVVRTLQTIETNQPHNNPLDL